jgi:FMN-dependent NADH-azoreductase
MSLLHLDSSANRCPESLSRRLTAQFAGAWRARHPGGAYRHRDLAASSVPPLDAAFCALGRRAEHRGLVPLAQVAALAATPAERRAWAAARPLIEEILAASTILLGAPMYNFGVPAALKAWIDRVSFPGAFTDPGTGHSLLRTATVIAVTPRGGTYAPGTPRQDCDFQGPYLRAYFRRHGVAEENIHLVCPELTLAGLVPHLASSRPQAAASLASAEAQLTALAAAPDPAADTMGLLDLQRS